MSISGGKANVSELCCDSLSVFSTMSNLVFVQRFFLKKCEFFCLCQAFVWIFLQFLFENLKFCVYMM